MKCKNVHQGFQLGIHITPGFQVMSVEIPQEIITKKSQHCFLNFLYYATTPFKVTHSDQAILLAISSEVFQVHPYSCMQ